MTDSWMPIVERAKEGDKGALEELILRLQDRIYAISLRMLYHPQDAEDATQEILIKIITRLDSFRGAGSFEGWSLRVASNHLLSFRRKRGRAAISFDQMADRIETDWPKPWRELEAEPIQELIVEEFRIACLQMVLLGLDRGHRLAYLLGEIFSLTGQQAADVLHIRPAAFRKRLQRSKTRIQTFLSTHCALINPNNACLCERQADRALSAGWINKNDVSFVNHPCYVRHHPAVRDRLRELDELQRIGTLLRINPQIETPNTFVEHLRGLIDSNRFQLLMNS